MTPQEIINEIHKLPPVERKEVFDTLAEEITEVGSNQLLKSRINKEEKERIPRQSTQDSYF